ncbi:MAG: alpha/beta fold hydrolase [Acidimicrobiales bacterium]
MTTSDGRELAYDVSGTGPVLVLVHGITENRHMWDPLLPGLASDHCVVRVDLRGHGESGAVGPYDPESMADDIGEVVAGLGLDDPLVVGHSLGGIVVTAYAAAHPCRGALNIDQSLALAEFQQALRQIEPMLRGDPAAFEATVSALLDSMAGALDPAESARLGGLRHPRQDVVLGVWAPLLESTPEAIDAMVRTMVGRLQVPYLCIHGSDPGSEYPGWLAELVPGAVVEVWPGLGHFPHLAEPERFVARLAAFESRAGWVGGEPAI